MSENRPQRRRGLDLAIPYRARKWLGERFPNTSGKPRRDGFISHSGGAIALWFALTAPAVVAAGGLAVDWGYLITVDGRLQSAADAAALAAVQDLNSLPTATDRAMTIAAMNVPASWGVVTTAADVEFGTYDPATKTFTVINGGANAKTPDAVRVKAARDISHGNAATLFLTRAFRGSTTDVSASAVATGKGGAGACLISLDTKNTASGFVVSGKGKVNVPACGIQVNSAHTRAFNQSGSGGVYTTSIDVVGGSTYTIAVPTPITGRPVLQDPLLSVPEPSPPNRCDYTDATFNTPMNFPAGTVFCGKIAFNGNVVLQPGVHYFVGADVTTGPNTELRGSEVMLYLDATSTLSSASTGVFYIKAPQTGEYAGIALFASRKARLTQIKLTGSSNYTMIGTIYAPGSVVALSGTSEIGVSAKSGFVVAFRFSYSGDSDFTFDASGGASPNVLSPAKIALVM